MPIINKSTFVNAVKKARFHSLAPSTLEKRGVKKRLFRKAIAELYWSDSARFSEVNKATGGRVLRELKLLSLVAPKSIVVEWGCGREKRLPLLQNCFLQ